MAKIMTVLGTRPEIIRLSRVMPALDRAFEHVIVHTGQNAAPSLRDVFFDELGLRRPDMSLGMAAARPGAALARLFEGVEEAILRHRPRVMLILGDTNSALACLVARRHGLLVYHMEAGNRCFDRESPEEANRRVVDHAADYNLAYTEAARRNLLREGLHPARIWVTGSPLREVIEHHRDAIAGSDAPARLGVAPRGYLLASLHRQENVDQPARLAGLIAALGRLHAETGLAVIVSTHPRTRDRLRAGGPAVPPGLRLLEPFGFIDWCRLQQDAACVVSDSGTLPEEAAILGFRAVVARRAMERPEAMETGAVVLGGITPDQLLAATRLALDRPPPGLAPPDYAPPDVSRRVVGLIASTWHTADPTA
jgi:UDP-N-acetylglucosamine 2-epimerase (non-hydrolysing)